MNAGRSIWNATQQLRSASEAMSGDLEMRSAFRIAHIFEGQPWTQHKT